MKKMSKNSKEILKHQEEQKEFDKRIQAELAPLIKEGSAAPSIATKEKVISKPKPIKPIKTHKDYDSEGNPLVELQKTAEGLMSTIKIENLKEDFSKLTAEMEAEMEAVKGAISVVVGNLGIYKLILEKKVADKTLVEGIAAIETLLKLTVELSTKPKLPEEKLQDALNHLDFDGNYVGSK